MVLPTEIWGQLTDHTNRPRLNAKIEKKRTEIAELKHVYLNGYGIDAAYSTIDLLKNFPKTIKLLYASPSYYHRVSAAIKFAYAQQTEHSKGVNRWTR